MSNNWQKFLIVCDTKKKTDVRQSSPLVTHKELKLLFDNEKSALLKMIKIYKQNSFWWLDFVYLRIFIRWSYMWNREDIMKQTNVQLTSRLTFIIIFIQNFLWTYNPNVILHASECTTQVSFQIKSKKLSLYLRSNHRPWKNL